MMITHFTLLRNGYLKDLKNAESFTTMVDNDHRSDHKLDQGLGCANEAYGKAQSVQRAM